jgi:hypothetical protein
MIYVILDFLTDFVQKVLVFLKRRQFDPSNILPKTCVLLREIVPQIFGLNTRQVLHVILKVLRRREFIEVSQMLPLSFL